MVAAGAQNLRIAGVFDLGDGSYLVRMRRPEAGAVAQLAVMAQNLGDRRFNPGDPVRAVWRPEHTFVVS